MGARVAAARDGRGTALVHCAVVGAALLVVALTAAFLWVQITSPSDGARLVPGEAVWRADGVVVTPFREQPGGLRRGDRVVAVDGQSLESRARSLLRRDSPPSRWERGQTVVYTVVREGQVVGLPITLGDYAPGAILAREWGFLVFLGVTQIVATFVYLRRPGEPAARALFLWASCLLGNVAFACGLTVGNLVGGPGYWLYAATVYGAFILSMSAVLHSGLAFGRPRLPRRVLWAIYVAPHLLYLAYLAATVRASSSTLQWLGGWLAGVYGVTIVYILAYLIVLIRTYLRSPDAITRTRIRWVLFGGSISAALYLAFGVLPVLVTGRALLPFSILLVLMLPFPLSLAVAVLRYRLFDIDLIINRALVYGSLTGALALVYAGSVALLHHLLRPFLGRDNQLAIVASTLVIAALFQPMRRRLQATIDRRFNRQRYDAQRTLALFGASLRDETDLERLSADLLAVVQETMQPAHASLWLRSPSKAAQDAPGDGSVMGR